MSGFRIYIPEHHPLSQMANQTGKTDFSSYCNDATCWAKSRANPHA